MTLNEKLTLISNLEYAGFNDTTIHTIVEAKENPQATVTSFTDVKSAMKFLTTDDEKDTMR